MNPLSRKSIVIFGVCCHEFPKAIRLELLSAPTLASEWGKKKIIPMFGLLLPERKIMSLLTATWGVYRAQKQLFLLMSALSLYWGAYCEHFWVINITVNLK